LNDAGSDAGHDGGNGLKLRLARFGDRAIPVLAHNDNTAVLVSLIIGKATAPALIPKIRGLHMTAKQV